MDCTLPLNDRPIDGLKGNEMRLTCRLLLVMVLATCCTSVWCRAESEQTLWLANHESVSKLNPTAVAIDPRRGKLYVGGTGFNRMTLSVFDVNARCELLGPPRTYVDSLDPLPQDQRSIVKRLRLDPQGRSLFVLVGMAGASSHAYRPLTVYALDDHGEPTGAPLSVSIGNPNHACDDVAFHPRLPLAYAVGWGGSGVGVLTLDAQGRPRGDATWVVTGGDGKVRVTLRPDGGKLYLGAYPGQVNVVDLDAQGQIASPMRSYNLPQPRQAYLQLVAFERALYVDYLDEQSQPLQYLALDATGEPIGEARTVENLIVRDIMRSADHRKLLAVSLQSFSDAMTGEPRQGAAHVVELTLNAEGNPQQIKPCGEPLQDTAIHATSSEAPAVLAVTPARPKFHGNRYAGLEVRFTLEHVESSAPLDAATFEARFPGHDGYLRFDYSRRFNRVYAASPQALGSYAVRSDQPRFDVTASADLAGPVLVDDQREVLYAAAKDGRIVVRSLTDEGAIDAGETRLSTGIANITGLALHPGSGKVYVMGYGPGAPADDPRIITVPQASSGLVGVVSVRHARLYTATQNASGPNLWMWRLDDQGHLTDTQPTPIADGLPASTPGHPSIAAALALSDEHGLLFVGGGAQSAPPASVGIAVHRLSDQGEPTSAPRFFATANPRNSILALAISSDQQHLYECGWGWPTTSIWHVQPDGNLQRGEQQITFGGMGKAAVSPTKDGNFLLIGTNPGMLEITPMDSTGRPRPGVATKLGSQLIGMLQVGNPSHWLSLDEHLKDAIGEAVVRGELVAPSLQNATLRVEFRLRGGALAASFVEKYIGPRFAFIAPCYGSTTHDQVASLIQSVPDRYRQYKRMAEQYAVSPEDRPKQFLIANGLISIDDSIGSLDAGLSLLQTLGHNTVEMWHWGNLAPDALRSKAGEFGFQQFRMSVYKPPAYFDYVRDKVSPAFLDQWTGSAAIAGKGMANMGASGENVKLFHLADEPGWYFPYVIDDVTSNPAHLAAFHEYLQSNSLTAAFFGKATWDEVAPIRLSQVSDLPTRRLLHWTARFYAESFSRNLRAATDALQRRFHDKLHTTINLNNWPGQFFLPSPNTKIGNNNDIGPDAAMGMPNWFDLGRKRAATCFWTEDWFIDAEAQVWSVYGDLMRCAAREGGIEMGAYVVGRTTWQVPDGGAYKVLSLVGHGTKVFDFYTFGPAPAFGDGWSENEPSYQSIAQAIRLLGRGEKLLHPGRPKNGTVAILFPQASQVWDTPPLQHSYMTELYGLHAALVHEQYPVDFIDDVGVEAGNLDRYRYHTLYVTAPNLSLKAQRAIVKWVAEGGTLVVMPGAAAADEYNDHADVLSSILGVTRAQMVREPWPTAQQQRQVPPTMVAAGDPRLGTSTIPVHGPLAALSVGANASVLAHAGERPIVVKATHGRGHVFSYACWPGNAYWNSPDRSNQNRLPRNWLAGARQLITAPARMHGAPKWVHVNRAGVEACLLESPKGIAITLLNWTGEPLGDIEVSIPGVASVGQARSIQSGPLTASQSPDGLKLTLPLATVDVLLLEP